MSFKFEQSVVFASLTTAPTSPTNGQVYYDSTLNQLRVYENGAWKQLIGNDDATTLDGLDSTQFLRSDAADTATGKITVTGGLFVNSGTGVNPFTVARGGASNEAVEWYVDDGQSFQHYRNDESAANWVVRVENSDVETGGGAQANFADLRFRSEASGATLAISDDGGAWGTFWHQGNDGVGSGLDADLLDGFQGSSYLRSDVGDTYSGGTLYFDATTTGDYPWALRTVGDTSARVAIRGDGQIEIGSGSATRDVNLYRSSANTLKTDDAFVVGGVATINDTLRVSQAVDREFAVACDNGVANQKFDLHFSRFWGFLEITLRSGYSHQNAAGGITKAFHLGLGAGGSISNNVANYTDVGSLTADNWAISDVTWDATNSRYRIQVVHRVSTGNTAVISVRALAATSADADAIQNMGVGAVYTTDTTTFAKPSVPSSVAWHEGNDGAGSGLDADLLDGQEGAHYLNAANLTGTVASARLAGSYTGITGVGTVTAGTWNATTIAANRGGTGISSYTANNYLRALNATTLEQRTPAQVLSDIGAASSSHNHDSSYVLKAGDTMTGLLTLSGAPTAANHAATKAYVDGLTGGSPVTSVSGTAPIVSSGGTTPAISITAASGSSAGSMSSSDFTKLAGIETGATADQTGAEILALLLPVDGAGSSLDADLLDGQQGSYYTDSANLTGTIASARLAGSYTGITGVGTVTVGTWNATTIAANRGGTGHATYAVGDLIQATAATTLSRLAAVATGNVLLSGGVGVASTWGKVGLTTHVTGALTILNGGTGLTSVSNGNFLTGGTGNVMIQRTPAQVRSDIGAVAKATATSSAGLTTTVTHNLGTYDVQVEAYTTASPRRSILVTVDRPTTNTVLVTFGSTVSAGDYTIVVTG